MLDAAGVFAAGSVLFSELATGGGGTSGCAVFKARRASLNPTSAFLNRGASLPLKAALISWVADRKELPRITRSIPGSRLGSVWEPEG